LKPLNFLILTGDKSMTDEELEKIKTRLKKASPGPWHFAGDEEEIEEGMFPGPHWIVDLPDLTHIGYIAKTADSLEEGAANAEFVANAPTDIAALLEEVDYLKSKFEIALRALEDIYMGMPILTTKSGKRIDWRKCCRWAIDRATKSFKEIGVVPWSYFNKTNE
jgi:hypothetical protein